MIKQTSHPGGDTLVEYPPGEDVFHSGFALWENILPRETFHQGIPTGMSYLLILTYRCHDCNAPMFINLNTFLLQVYVIRYTAPVMPAIHISMVAPPMSNHEQHQFNTTHSSSSSWFI